MPRGAINLQTKSAPGKTGTKKGTKGAAAKKPEPKKSGGGLFSFVNGAGKAKDNGAPKKATPTRTSAKKAAPAPKKKGSIFAFAQKSAPKAKAAPKAKPAPKRPAPKPLAAKRGTSTSRASAGTGTKRVGKEFAEGIQEQIAQWYGPNRRLYLPGGLLDPKDVKPELDGTLPGDYGFDPLNLSKSKDDVLKFREFELLHARWAMLGVLGVVAPELLGVKYGETFWKPGEMMLAGETLQYTAPPFGTFENPIPLPAIAAAQVGLMGLAEKYRKEGTGPEKGFAPKYGNWDGDVWRNVPDNLNPGGPLDFLGLGNDPDELALLKVREIKNGRLAMVAMLGVFAQAFVTREGAMENLLGAGEEFEAIFPEDTY